MSKTQFQGFRFPIDPTAFLVGDLREEIRRRGSGVHRIAEERGVSLWAELINGQAVDFRAFDEHGEELGIIIFKEPDPHAGPPTNELLRPVPDDAYVCAPLGDGGMICWRQ